MGWHCASTCILFLWWESSYLKLFALKQWKRGFHLCLAFTYGWTWMLIELLWNLIKPDISHAAYILYFSYRRGGRWLRIILFTTLDVHFCHLLNRNIEQEGLKAPLSVLHSLFQAASQEVRVMYLPSAWWAQWWELELRNTVPVLTEEHHHEPFLVGLPFSLCSRRSLY